MTGVAILLAVLSCPAVALANIGPTALPTAGGAEVTVSSGGSAAGGQGHHGSSTGHSTPPKNCKEGATTVTFGGLTILCPGKQAPGFNPGISATPLGPIVGLADPVPPPPTGSDVAQVAAAQLVVPSLDVATAPPRGGVQLAGVDVWFWAPGVASASATASIPGLSATVTAQPERLSISAGGKPVASCAGGGTAYSRSAAGSGDPGRACRHVFQDAGRLHVVATLVWSLTWTATDGTSGRLPDARRTTTFDLDIHDAYAVTD